MTEKAKIDTSKLGLEKGPFLLPPEAGKGQKGKNMGEKLAPPVATDNKPLLPLTLADIEKITTEIKEEKGNASAAAEARGLLDA